MEPSQKVLRRVTAVEVTPLEGVEPALEIWVEATIHPLADRHAHSPPGPGQIKRWTGNGVRKAECGLPDLA